jgi:ribosomal protein S18 acetylase RimI-like enzyme
VLKEARGRGAAKALLAEYFADTRRRGRTAAILHVDGANATGAVRLYESVGMRPTLHIDIWRRTVRTRST